MTTRKFFIELDFDLEEFDIDKLTPQYVLGVAESALCRKGVTVKVHTKNPYTV